MYNCGQHVKSNERNVNYFSDRLDFFRERYIATSCVCRIFDGKVNTF